MLVDQSPVLLRDRHHAPDSRVREAPLSVDSLAQTSHFCAPLELLELAVAHLGHQQARGIGAEVDYRDSLPCHRAPHRTLAQCPGLVPSHRDARTSSPPSPCRTMTATTCASATSGPSGRRRSSGCATTGERTAATTRCSCTAPVRSSKPPACRWC